MSGYIEQQKMLKVFQLIRHLSEKPYKTLNQLARYVGKHKRTVQRYMELLEELGYLIDQDANNCFFLIIDKYPAEKGVLFTFEESQLLRDLLRGRSEQNPLRDSIFKKLFIHSELQPLAENYLKTVNAALIRKLAQAIEEHRCVILQNYHSANTQSIRDRLVEPLMFGDNYSTLQAYEPESAQVKAFKVERIGDVELLDQYQTYAQTVDAPDLFGFIGVESWPVKLLLNDRAYRLLIEEYPAAKPHTSLTNARYSHPYSFEVNVHDEKGIGRFILGLPGDILVIAPQKLKNYLNQRIKNLKF